MSKKGITGVVINGQEVYVKEKRARIRPRHVRYIAQEAQKEFIPSQILIRAADLKTKPKK